MSQFPQDLRYTTDHEWIQSKDAGSARVGITDHAADALGDIVFVTLPTVGQQVAAGDSCGELESTKSISELYCPVSGVVTAVNSALAQTPELVNSSPYGDGWLFEIELADESGIDQLMNADEYAGHVEE